jgi:hypothetical protein
MFEYYNSLSDLWKGEQKIVAEISSSIPDNGVIVEIGTFQGGTARLFYDVTHKRNVKTFTVDINPLPIAYENLKKTNVEIIKKSSIEAAHTWDESIKKKIDLLFIDGSHRFENVFEDFNAWINFLNPGGTIIFHDYDPIERGGLAHLGVKIFVDSIIRKGFLKNPRHKYKLLYGTLKNPENNQLTINDCSETFAELGKAIVRLREDNHSGWTLVADDRFSLLLKGCIKTEGIDGPLLPSEIAETNHNYLLSLHPMGMPLDILHTKGVSKNFIKTIDSLKACYLVYHALKNNFNYLHNISSNRAELVRWKEILEMIEHAYGQPIFPDEISKYIKNINVQELSKLISQEQVRLNILAQIVKTFVDWIP